MFPFRHTALCAAIAALAASATAQQPAIERKPVRVVRTIGEDGTGEYAFAFINRMAVSKDGSLFVDDRATIKVFDESGRFVRKFGGIGGGPGEFRSTASLTVTDSVIEVRDRSTLRVVHFTPAGRHVTTKQLKRAEWLQRTFPLRVGQQLVVRTPECQRPMFMRDTTPCHIVVGLQAAGRDVSPFFQIRTDTVYFVDAGMSMQYGMTMRSTRFGAGGAWALAGDSLVAHVDGYSGAVTWYSIDANGPRAVRTMLLGAVGAPTTKDDVAAESARIARLNHGVGAGRAGPAVPATGDMYGVPAQWSVATKAFFATDGTLWVGNPRSTSVRAASGKAEPVPEPNVWTAFPPNGRPYTVDLPPFFRLNAARGNMLYGRNVLDTGEHVVVIFAVEGT